MVQPEKDPIEIHIRTYRSLLRAAGEVDIEKLIDSHQSLSSILHEKASSKEIDIAAFIYVLLRLPFCMSLIKKIILGQSFDVFKNNGFGHIRKWQEVEAPGRRRKMYFNGKDTLAVYIASVTDVDDMITLLTAFQIEWNNFHKQLSQVKDIEGKVNKLVKKEDVERIKRIWEKDYFNFLKAIQKRKVDFTVSLLEGSYREYAKATQRWWNDITSKLPQIDFYKRPIYFVSSNTHSIVNLLTKFATYHQRDLIDFLYKLNDKSLIKVWYEIRASSSRIAKEHFLFYIAKKYSQKNPSFDQKRRAQEKRLGIHHIPASIYLDIDVQAIELKKFVKGSNALIINIDYPLGWAAYQVLTEISQNVETVKGAYIMGKAATLNGAIGDILIPNSVFDQHTKNVYVFKNTISRNDFKGIVKNGSLLDNQKTVSVKGTFLENEKFLRLCYREGYTIIEMEAGPYLNALYEFVYYSRYQENQFINLTNTPFEIGIAHYASDTPYSKAKNLGVRHLSYRGVAPTYAISRVILNKIIEGEKKQ